MSTISTTITHGITLSTGGTYSSPLTITATGAVEASAGNAIYGNASQAWAVENQGTIATTAANGIGIYLAAGGNVTNAGTGLISGAKGILVGNAAATITNAGTITGTGGTAVSFG